MIMNTLSLTCCDSSSRVSELLQCWAGLQERRERERLSCFKCSLFSQPQSAESEQHSELGANLFFLLKEMSMYAVEEIGYEQMEQVERRKRVAARFLIQLSEHKTSLP